MADVQVNPEISYSPAIDKIDSLVGVALTRLDFDPKAVSFGIHFTTNEEIQKLNAQYRGYDKPTDVLSFEANVFDPEMNVTYLGDIIISAPIMQRQANLADHPVDTEMLLLITHGILHLAGYDHATDEEKAEMWQVQAEILESVGVVPNKLPED